MKTRRNFIQSTLRWCGVLTLGGGASLLAWRSSRSTCVRNNPCGTCPLFSGCDLEKARDTKQNNPKPHAG